MAGIVVMPDGAPAAAADVWLESESTCRGTDADAQGRFEFNGVPPPGGEITARLDDLVATTDVRLHEGGAVSDVRLVLSPREVSYVRVRVLDGKGRGVREACVCREDAGDDGTVTVRLSEPPGAETGLRVTAPGFLDTTIRARTFRSPALAPLVEVSLRPGVHILLDASAPDGTPLVARASFTRDGETRGRVCLEPDATYDVEIGADGYLPLEIKEWRTPSSDGVLAVTLRPCAAMKGRIVDHHGEPVTCGRAVFGGEWASDLSCERDGSFLLEGLPEGRGLLSFVRSGRAEAAREIETVSGQVTDVGTVMLEPPVALTGRVVDPALLPLGGAVVRAEGDRTFSHADGTFRILVPPFASVSVIVRKRGFGTVRTEPGPARSLGDIVLAPAVEVERAGLEPEPEDLEPEPEDLELELPDLELER